MSNPTYKELVQVQMQEFPQSIIMTHHDVMLWAREKPADKQMMAYRHICTAGYYNEVVWYTLDEYQHDGIKRPWGFRYGLEGGQYVSGFADI